MTYLSMEERYGIKYLYDERFTYMCVQSLKTKIEMVPRERKMSIYIYVVDVIHKPAPCSRPNFTGEGVN